MEDDAGPSGRVVRDGSRRVCGSGGAATNTIAGAYGTTITTPLSAAGTYTLYFLKKGMGNKSRGERAADRPHFHVQGIHPHGSWRRGQRMPHERHLQDSSRRKAPHTHSHP